MRALYPALATAALLLAVQASAKTSHDAAPHPDPAPRCKIEGFVGVTSSVPASEKVARLGADVEGGAFVTNVVACSGAEAAGIRPLDYLVAVDGRRASAQTPFFCLLEGVAPGTEVAVSIWRDGALTERTLTLGRRGAACSAQAPFPKRGFFGINHGITTGERPGLILDVTEGGAVADLGLRDGDRLLRIDGHAVNDWDDLSTVKRLLGDLDDVRFDVVRDGRDLSLTGSIADREYGSDWVSNHVGAPTDRSSAWGWLAQDDDDDDRSQFARDECNEALAEALRVLDTIDFDAFEREAESAMRELNSAEFRARARSAFEESMAEMRDAMDQLRELELPRIGRADAVGADRSRGAPARDMGARLEPVRPSDKQRLRERSVDMPADDSLVPSDFQASPNPSDGRFRVSFTLPSSGQTSVVVYSAVGREVYRYDLGEFSGTFADELDVMRNGPGAYFLVVRQGGRVFSRKLVFFER